MTTTMVPKRDLGLARKRLVAAQSALTAGQPSPAQIRKARAAAESAIESLDAHIEALIAADAEGHKALARKLAVGRKDGRGYKRPAQTMPGYNKGRSPASKGKRYKATPPTVNEVLRMLALAPALRKVYVPQSRVVSELRSRPVPQVSMFDVLNSEGRNGRTAATPALAAPDLMGAFGSNGRVTA